MITKAKFTNYKLLRNVEFPLARFNVIVGANGAGKSSVLEGLHYLLQLGVDRNDSDQFVGGRVKTLFRGSRDPSLLISRPDQKHFQLHVAGERFHTFALTCKRKKDAGEFEFTLRLQGNDPAGELQEHSLNKVDVHSNTFFEQLSALRLASAVRLRLDASRLAEDHYSEDKRPKVEYDGTGLASVLQDLHNERDGRFAAIEQDLAKIVPSARRIRTPRARIVRREKIKLSIDGQESWSEQQREYTGSGIEVEWGKVGWIPASHLSEGTLLALGIITVLHHQPPSMILLDDLDKALHPTAQRELVGFLKQVVQSRPDLQVLATTHSPYVVEQLEPENVLVVGMADELTSSVRQLSDHPKWTRQRSYLDPGEFWSATGESWVADKPG